MFASHTPPCVMLTSFGLEKVFLRYPNTGKGYVSILVGPPLRNNNKFSWLLVRLWYTQNTTHIGTSKVQTSCLPLESVVSAANPDEGARGVEFRA